MEKIYRVQMNSKGMPNFSTAEEIKQEWIPCSERLPSEIGYYLVTTDGSHNSVIDIAEYNDWETGELRWFKSSKVLAWMPLPKPWKGADDE